MKLDVGGICEECASPLSVRTHFGDWNVDEPKGLLMAKLWFCSSCHPELETCLIEI